MRRPGASRGGGIEPGRQRPAKIDGRSRQNPAYRPGHFSRKGNSFRLFSFFLFFSLLVGRRGAFCWGFFFDPFYAFLSFLLFPSTRLPLRGTSQAAGNGFFAESFCYPLTFTENFTFFLRRAQAAPGPYFLASRK